MATDVSPVSEVVEGGEGPARRRLRLPEQPTLRHLLLAVLAGIAVFILSDNMGAFRDFQLSQIAYYAIALGGLTVLTGQNGQLSLGHGALMAIGAYTAALLTKHNPHIPVFVVLVASIAVTAASGAVIGVAAARLRGPYLAGVTLALAVALPDLATKYASVFGGGQGIPVDPLAPPNSLGVNFTPQRWLAWLSSLAALIVLALLANLGRSRVGRAFRAVRDDEIAASLAGIHVARTQVLAFVVSAACAGLAGAFLAYTTGLVAPGGFTLFLSLSLVTGIVVGGLGSLMGAVWGAIILVYLQEVAVNFGKAVHLSGSVGADLAQALYGVVLIVAILAFPQGIQGGIRKLGALLRRTRGPARSPATEQA